MNKETLKTRVDNIIESRGDDEAAHSMEDQLHVDIINEFCPDWIKEEVKRLSEADFARWCA